ncbi:MAG TPA: ion channel [Candidatus Binataceae bacterium]|nr:ion channel [Candidatus Binataceae bacterium]
MATEAKELSAIVRVDPARNALRRPGQFTILLIAMLAFLLIPPFFINYEPTGVLASTFLSLLLMSALYVFPRRHEFKTAFILAIPTLVGRWLMLAFHDNLIFLAAVSLCWLCFLILTDLVVLRQVLSATHVTNDTISGAICGYLLLGLIFAFVYALIALAYPRSFLTEGRVFDPIGSKVFYQHEISGLIYYSYVTLATLGYGDITPLSAPARMVAALEAIAGQFYVAILIARLVSIRYSNWGNHN